MLEIEGKLGVIWDDLQDGRISIPVRSEAIFDKARAKAYRPKFDTSVMTEVSSTQHCFHAETDKILGCSQRAQ